MLSFYFQNIDIQLTNLEFRRAGFKSCVDSHPLVHSILLVLLQVSINGVQYSDNVKSC